MHQTELDIAALRAIQVDRGLTDSELASAMGVSDRTLHRWLAGSSPGWNRIVHAARNLGVEPVVMVVRINQAEAAQQ